MELKSIDNNWNKMELTAGSIRVLFSYGTPVACRDTNGEYYFLEHDGRTDFEMKVSDHWAVKSRDRLNTVTEHINRWLADVEAATPMPQDFFDSLKMEEIEIGAYG